MNYGDGETQSYSFDCMDNRLTKSDTSTGSGTTATASTAYTYDAANRLTGWSPGTGTTTVTSDANGNTLTDGTHTNTWDSQNRLVSCVVGGSSGGVTILGSGPSTPSTTTSAYVYGSDGLRRRGTVTATDGTKTRTDYVYDNSMLVEEIVQHFSATGSAIDSPTTTTYFQGPQGPLYRKSSTVADPGWYVYDGLGSVVGEVNATGTMTANKMFDVYGATRGYTGTPTTRQGFVGGLGHETDDETGLMYMRAHYYDCTTGRFINQDISKAGKNWFIYCDNNPVNMVDADGKRPKQLNNMQQWELLCGNTFAAVALLLIASIAAGGLEKFYIIFAFVIAICGAMLIADALKDILVGDPMVQGGIFLGLSFLINQAFSVVNTEGLELMSNVIPNLANAVSGVLATAVLDEVYIDTMS